jgi:hypothetical protein
MAADVAIYSIAGHRFSDKGIVLMAADLANICSVVEMFIPAYFVWWLDADSDLTYGNTKYWCISDIAIPRSLHSAKNILWARDYNTIYWWSQQVLQSI